jgi:hypothetical protein
MPLDWRSKVYIYCERGTAPDFWAEPLNALSNAAFFVAGLAALYHLSTRRDIDRGADVWLLSVLVLVIGTGSFLFHTFAEQWASLADVVPITLFILTFLFTALRTLAGAPWWLALLLLLPFLGLSQWIGGLQCGGRSCLNGSIAYLPAFGGLAVFALLVAARRHPSAPWMAAGLATFALSLTFRTIDLPFCPELTFGGHAIGSHFLWHILNGTLLYLLLRALMARPVRS